MKPFSPLCCQSTRAKLVACRLSKALRIACLVAAAAASGTSASEIMLIASAATVTVTAQHTSADQQLARTQFFDNYDAAARHELELVADYPKTTAALNQRLEGTVGVAFEVNSRGVLQQAEVIQSSRSKILDSAALASVRWAKYPAFAADIQANVASRRYTVIFDYRLAAKQ